jgi:hypothetical protein
MCAGAAQALEFESGGSYNPSRHSRFLIGTFPDKPVPNSVFFMAPLEDQLRGVGWQTSHPVKKVALITPQHFLTATHYKATGSITFLDAAGDLRTFRVVKVDRISLDISIGTLEVPIPKHLGIHPFPVASVSGDGPKGRELFYVGNPPKGPPTMAVGRTAFYKTRNESMAELQNEGVSVRYLFDRVRGVTGDSGSPTFFLSDGELILLGHHYTARQDFILGLQSKAVNAYISDAGYSLDMRRAPDSCGDGAIQGAFVTLAIIGWRKRNTK